MRAPRRVQPKRYIVWRKASIVISISWLHPPINDGTAVAMRVCESTRARCGRRHRRGRGRASTRRRRPRFRPRYRSAPPLIRFICFMNTLLRRIGRIPCPLRDSAPLFLRRQCDRALRRDLREPADARALLGEQLRGRGLGADVDATLTQPCTLCMKNLQ